MLIESWKLGSGAAKTRVLAVRGRSGETKHWVTAVFPGSDSDSGFNENNLRVNVQGIPVLAWKLRTQFERQKDGLRPLQSLVACPSLTA